MNKIDLAKKREYRELKRKHKRRMLKLYPESFHSSTSYVPKEAAFEAPSFFNRAQDWFKKVF